MSILICDYPNIVDETLLEALTVDGVAATILPYATEQQEIVTGNVYSAFLNSCEHVNTHTVYVVFRSLPDFFTRYVKDLYDTNAIEVPEWVTSLDIFWTWLFDSNLSLVRTVCKLWKTFEHRRFMPMANLVSSKQPFTINGSTVVLSEPQSLPQGLNQALVSVALTL
jgi:hypothetical protein